MDSSGLQSSGVIFFVLAGLVVIALMLGFIVYFIVSYRHKKKDADLLNLQKKEIEDQKKVVEKTLEQLAEAQDHLIQSEKMASLGLLIAGISHEIQNPLNFVKNFSEINQELISELKDALDNNDNNEIKEILSNLDENMSKIVFHGNRADSIVKGMLTHSRNSQGSKVAKDINALAEEYMRLSYHGFKAKEKSFSATLETDLASNLPLVPVIEEEISRVFLNLFTNAFYATFEKKKLNPDHFEARVLLKTSLFNNRVEIQICDNGNGIPSKNIEKIFQPFFTTKPSGEGTGLGLSLSYNIIKAGHDGEIKVESNPNEGSCFKIYLKYE
ncbi:MAG: two-component sensor histidine kinase [Saprospiraceae bacterium]|nr:two-component sensor histidine kinase [Saprospiraceae bacterium]